MSAALAQPNAKAIFLPADTAALANANPTCLAAQTNMILCDSDKANGDSVLPVPVGAIYKTILGHFCLQIVNISF